MHAYIHTYIYVYIYTYIYIYIQMRIGPTPINFHVWGVNIHLPAILVFSRGVDPSIVSCSTNDGSFSGNNGRMF